jgi:hypothetical protein
MSRPGVAAPERLRDGPGIAVLVTAVPGGVRSATDDAAAPIAWLARNRAPRTGEVLTRLQRHGWTLKLPDPAAATQSELWASARFAGVKQARAAARPFRGARRSPDALDTRRPAGRDDVGTGDRAARRAARVTVGGRLSHGSQTAVTGKMTWVWAVTSDGCGWFSGWRRADSRLLCRLAGLTGKACVARRRPRTFGVT